MQFLTCDVNTYCIGQAASMGAVLLCGGTKGKRYALPNSNIMIHQVLGGAEGQASDVEIRVKYMLKLKQRLNGIISKHTGKSDRAGGEGLRPRQFHVAPRKPRPTAWWTKSCNRAKKFPVLTERATSLADKKE